MKMLNENYYNRLAPLRPIMEKFEATQIFDCPFSVTRRMQEAYDWLGLGKQDLGCSACVHSMAKTLWRMMKEYEGAPTPELVTNNLKVETIDQSSEYDTLTRKELVSLAKERGHKNPAKVKSAKLIEWLEFYKG